MGNLLAEGAEAERTAWSTEVFITCDNHFTVAAAFGWSGLRLADQGRLHLGDFTLFCVEVRTAILR